MDSSYWPTRCLPNVCQMSAWTYFTPIECHVTSGSCWPRKQKDKQEPKEHAIPDPTGHICSIKAGFIWQVNYNCFSKNRYMGYSQIMQGDIVLHIKCLCHAPSCCCFFVMEKHRTSFSIFSIKVNVSEFERVSCPSINRLFSHQFCFLVFQ